MLKKSESMLSVLDASMKTTTSVSDLQKLGIEIEGLTDDMEHKEREKLLRSYRRKIANRESAKRSKIRKKAEDAKLLDTAKTLLSDSESMRKTIKDLHKKVDQLHAENARLRIRLGENQGAGAPAVEPVNLPPPVEPPSLVVREAQKIRRGMMKVTSDSSIATNFDDELALRGGTEQVAVKRSKKDGKFTQSDNKAAFNDGRADYILDSFWQSSATQRQEQSNSPFFTDNFVMYNFQDGEYVLPTRAINEETFF
jgi:hypothetical protein